MRKFLVTIMGLALVLGMGGAFVAPVGASDAGTLEARDPITLIGDGSLCEDELTAIINCDSALGTASSPYEIKGWSIAASGTPALEIRDTTLHIVVAGNAFSGDPANPAAAVVLTNVENLRFEDNTVDGGGAEALVLDGVSDAAFERNTFTSGGAAAATAFATGAGHVTFNGNAFRGASGIGHLLHVDGATSLVLGGNDYTSVDGSALDAVALRLDRVLGAAVGGETVTLVSEAIMIGDSESVSLEGVTLDRVRNGVTATNSGTLTVMDSGIEDGWPCKACDLETSGFSLDHTSLQIANARIHDFDIGIHILGYPTASDPTRMLLNATSVELTENKIGLLNEGDGVVEIDASNIAGNAEWGIRNLAENVVSALNVWWGHADGPSQGASMKAGDRVGGGVDYNPHAEAPFTIAP